MKGKIRLIILVSGKVKSGKSHFAMAGFSGNGSDTVMLDITRDANARVAAMNVYGDRIDDKYFTPENWQELEKIIESVKEPTICIDESANLRDMYAQRYLAETKKKRVFPTTEYSVVYDYIKDMFLRFSEKNFIITSGLREVRVYKESIDAEVVIGKEPDGLRILPSLADVIFYVELFKKKAQGKNDRQRRIEVVANRLIDYTSDKWITTVPSLKVFIDEVVKRTSIPKEVFYI